uniref:Uncharacterized protein n=1 Tax=Pfiesteria piscicida TaxID=71001 RepID=A3E3R4_PFIPI|nr:unknown [Pfiesteria piscicida]
MPSVVAPLLAGRWRVPLKGHRRASVSDPQQHRRADAAAERWVELVSGCASSSSAPRGLGSSMIAGGSDTSRCQANFTMHLGVTRAGRRLLLPGQRVSPIDGLVLPPVRSPPRSRRWHTTPYRHRSRSRSRSRLLDRRWGDGLANSSPAGAQVAAGAKGHQVLAAQVQLQPVVLLQRGHKLPLVPKATKCWLHKCSCSLSCCFQMPWKVCSGRVVPIPCA